jgi:hypothetical protein
MPRKNLNKLFCLSGFHKKCNFQYAFDDDLRVTQVFIQQIFRAVEVAPPFPLPHSAVQGGGVVVALFSHKPWLWL